MNGRFQSDPTTPKLPEMVQSHVPRLATACGEKPDAEDSRIGAAAAEPTLADGITTREAMDADWSCRPPFTGGESQELQAQDRFRET